MTSHLVQRLIKSINTPFARSLNPAQLALLQSFKLKIETNKGKARKLSKQIVHVNNSLLLSDIKVLGFDLDYTLVTYSDDLQLLIYSLAKDVLINLYAFPSDLKCIQFDPNFAIRGLFVDPKNGTICKLSHLQRIGTNFTFKGRKKLEISEIESIYGESRHISYGNLKAMRRLNDLFSMAEGCLIADCIDCFESARKRTGEEYSAPAIIDDVQAAIKNIHVSGSLHNHILADMDRYIVHNPKLGKMLEHLQVSGKRLFLCTNR
jgi:HAD superfamily 5'-nucleotidase-like hydrolase